MDSEMENPWNVEDLDNFLYFCCPECDLKDQSKVHLLNFIEFVCPFLKMVYELGQEVLQCHPFAHIVLKSKREYVCDFCLRNAFEVLNKCGACKKVYYCQRECQKKAWKSYHKYECEVLVNPENNNWENQNITTG